MLVAFATQRAVSVSPDLLCHLCPGSVEEGTVLCQRRSCLPSQSPNNSTISLWNILRNNIGKDLSKVAMPVQLNEPLNTLQRLCEELEYSELLDRAANTQDPFERMVRWQIHSLLFECVGRVFFAQITCSYSADDNGPPLTEAVSVGEASVAISAKVLRFLRTETSFERFKWIFCSKKWRKTLHHIPDQKEPSFNWRVRAACACDMPMLKEFSCNSYKHHLTITAGQGRFKLLSSTIVEAWNYPLLVAGCYSSRPGTTAACWQRYCPVLVPVLLITLHEVKNPNLCLQISSRKSAWFCLFQCSTFARICIGWLWSDGVCWLKFVLFFCVGGVEIQPVGSNVQHTVHTVNVKWRAVSAPVCGLPLWCGSNYQCSLGSARSIQSVTLLITVEWRGN